MPRYYLQAGEYELDIERMSATVKKRSYQMMRQAARIYLREAIKHIPVWTGEAMGSLAPIARELHVHIPQTKDADAPVNGFSLGESQAYTSEPFIQQENWKFSFTIGSSVPHFNINEFHNVAKYGILLRNPTPWKAFTYGAEAAGVYLDEMGPKIFPNFADFTILKSEIRYG